MEHLTPLVATDRIHCPPLISTPDVRYWVTCKEMVSCIYILVQCFSGWIKATVCGLLSDVL